MAVSSEFQRGLAAREAEGVRLRVPLVNKSCHGGPSIVDRSATMSLANRSSLPPRKMNKV